MWTVDAGSPRLLGALAARPAWLLACVAVMALAGCQALLGLNEPQLGDGISDAGPDAAAAEVCDDGVDNDGDGDADCADADCSCPNCGDGAVDPGEQCDDGNASDTDDCLTGCVLASCGDGVVDGQGPEVEECDDAGASAACDDDCTAPMCGDGNVNGTAGEDCDDGTGANSQTCDADCTAVMCGDGLVNSAAGEACDDSGESMTCDVDCSPAVCGDGVANMAAGEACDDAGESVLCDADCTAPECGDGVFNASAEVCDDGGNSATCDADCTAVVCGDGFVNPVIEQCDDSGNSATCDADCTVVACGDGFFNPVVEQCDDGGNSAACDADCTPVLCGDGFANPVVEQCDDGNTASGDGCSATCTLEGTPCPAALFPINNVAASNSFGDLAFDGGGDLLVAGGFTRQIMRVDCGSGAVTTIASNVGTSSANGVTFNPSDGLIYALGNGSGAVLVSIDAGGVTTTVATLSGTFNAIAVAPPTFGAFGGRIIAVNTSSQVVAIDPATGGTTIVGTTTGILSDLVFAGDGRLFVANNSNASIQQVDAAGVFTVVASGLPNAPDGVAIDNAGNRLFVASGGSGALTQVTLPGGALSNLGTFGFDPGFFVSGVIFDQISTLIMGTGSGVLNLQAITP